MQPQKVYSLRPVTDLKDMVSSSCELYADNTAFLWRDPQTKEIVEVKYSQVEEDVKNLATYLNARGLEGKIIGVMGKNSYRWAISYLAIGAGCGIIMPVDKEFGAEQLTYVLQHSEAAAILYDDDVEKTVQAADADPLCIPFSSFPAVLEAGRAMREAGDHSYENHKINPVEFGILLYTSGTTGAAKGVMLSQFNVCSNVRQALSGCHYSPEDRGLSVLPLHHTYECTAGFLGFFYSGASIAYNGSLRTILQDLKDFSPTIFVSVPLILEMFYRNIMKKYEAVPGGKLMLKSQLAIAAGLTMDGRKSLFSVINKTLGGRLRLFLVGAAPVPPQIFKAFWRFGFAVYIGYGLTETSPISIQHSDDYQNPYDCGFPSMGVQARIDDPDENGVGELVVKGCNVMLGYYKDPEETARVLENGWFHTGDLAKVTERGSYTITGRIKSMIVASNGKKIFPEELEEYLGASPLVKECLVYNRPNSRKSYVIAAIIPDEDAMQEKWKGEGEMPLEEKKALLKELVTTINRKFPGYKHIRGVVLREIPFEKTTTQKIKRNDPKNIIDIDENDAEAEE